MWFSGLKYCETNDALKTKVDKIGNESLILSKFVDFKACVISISSMLKYPRLKVATVDYIYRSGLLCTGVLDN